MHATYKAYKAGCRCTPCRASNAAHVSAWRGLKLRRASDGKQRAIIARRRVRQLEREGYPKGRIAKLAGWKDGRAYHVTFRLGQTIRRQTLERILRVARFAMLEGV